jgi:hypothetical protein
MGALIGQPGTKDRDPWGNVHGVWGRGRRMRSCGYVYMQCTNLIRQLGMCGGAWEVGCGTGMRFCDKKDKIDHMHESGGAGDGR